MEEASHLASRAAILSKRILALGTIPNLRHRYGNVYHVHLILKSAPESERGEMEAVEKWVVRCFEGARVESWGSVGGQVRFWVPADVEIGVKEIKDEGVGERGDEIQRVGEREGKKSGVGSLFRKLEESREEIGLAFYSEGYDYG
jgi:ATP-binding cassette subfamily A (ABC1) protein 3